MQTNENLKNNPFTICVIVNGSNMEDIAYYNEQFRKLNEMYGDELKLLFFGYVPEEDLDNALAGVAYKYHKRVSYTHYWKQLKALNPDVLFVPLMYNMFNLTSEDSKKYLEAGALKIPLLTIDAAPYNYQGYIQNRLNGFLYKNREEFIEYFSRTFADQPKAIAKMAGNQAQQNVLREYNYNPENAQLLAKLFE